MEEPSSHGDVKGGNFDDHSGCKPTSAEDGVQQDDPPPIPSASSSIQLTDKSLGESRLDNNNNKTHASSIDSDVDITLRAHTLTVEAVATELNTNVQ